MSNKDLKYKNKDLKYKNKYLKYKTKYLDLKSQIGGSPSAPTNVIATPLDGNGNFVVSWTEPVNNGDSPITSYTITSSPVGITKTVDNSTTATDTGLNKVIHTFTVVELNDAGNSTKATVTGLNKDTSYTFTVVASNEAGNSAESVASPSAPTNVIATPLDGNGDVKVSWIEPVDNGGSPITSYTIRRSPVGVGITKTVGNSTNATVTGLDKDISYTFTVVAANEVGNSAESVASPSAPTNVIATPLDGNGNVVVSWIEPVDNGGSPITSYTIIRSPVGVGITKIVGKSTEAIVTGLDKDISYTFTVVVSNEADNSAESVASNLVTPVDHLIERVIQKLPEEFKIIIAEDVMIRFNTKGNERVTQYVLTSLKQKLRLSESLPIEDMFISVPIALYLPKYLSNVEILKLAQIFITNISKLPPREMITSPFIKFVSPSSNPNPNPGPDRFDLTNLIDLLRIPSKDELELFLNKDYYLDDNQLHFELFFIFICILIKKTQLEAAALSETQTLATEQAVVYVSPLEIKKFNIHILYIDDINLSLFTKSFNLIIMGLKNNLIKRLVLISTSIGGEAKQLANELQTNTTLQELTFYNNAMVNITVAIAIQLGKALATNRTLKFLNLSCFTDNKSIVIAFIQEFARILSSLSVNNTTLKTFDFRNNKLRMEVIKTLVDALSKTTITRLFLGDNEIGEGTEGTEGIEKANAFGEALSKTTIRKLELSKNLIGDNIATALATALKTNTTLTELELSKNQIGDRGATSLADTLKTNTTLTQLDLRKNQIGDEGATSLADALKINPTLTELDLRKNQIGDEGATSLADALKINKTLEKLGLHDNSITDIGAKKLEEALIHKTKTT